MMDELDLLKKDWQQREEALPRLSFDQLHRMIWKRSSSLVRWIFYISIIEFIVPHLLYLVPSFRNGNGYDVARDLGIQTELIVVTVIQYAVVLYFIVQFYMRYREISVLEDASRLMDRIIRTRRTVKHYVIFCLSMILVIFGVFIAGMYFSDNLVGALHLHPDADQDPVQLKWLVMGIMAVLAILFTALMGGIYFLLYGLLTRRLYANYKELKRLDH
ncbi:hypothetical protein OZ410_09635 [Robiginitalea sp. M366]|uniref:hypothetical protein n=1 Tax=Robiginitalea aestuariiviva TaxID=3036903 RepID=UPI00240CF0B9|nr:hypothetical protein [Robiginitalea aestuariiviva]MDG1572577.1 hypothetical protein [Robiginitalea aestuariiviva]